MNYKGFYIDHIFRIFRNGKPIFTAWYQRCLDLESAKRMIDTSLEAKARFELEVNKSKLARLPDLDRISELREELESGAEAAEEFTDWMAREKQEQDYYHEINY